MDEDTPYPYPPHPERTEYRRSTLEERLNHEMAQYRLIRAGHRAVHPDRDRCGGVGGCLLLRTETDQRDEVSQLLDRTEAEGFSLRVQVLAS